MLVYWADSAAAVGTWSRSSAVCAERRKQSITPSPIGFPKGWILHWVSHSLVLGSPASWAPVTKKEKVWLPKGKKEKSFLSSAIYIMK